MKNIKRIVYLLFLALPFVIYGMVYAKMPDMVPVHYGINGQPDQYYGKFAACFLLPLALVGFNFLCILLTRLDPKHSNVDSKIKGLTYIICPSINLLLCVYTIYFTLGSGEFDISNFIIVFIGVLFMIIGNYMPKTKQNYTIGIKIPWTLDSEENWNKTHRFSGFIWTVGGFAILFTMFLPNVIKFIVMLTVTFIMAFVPMIYSYMLYKKGI